VSQNSSVSIVAGYGLDNLMIGVRFLAAAGNFSPQHHVQIGSGAHPASFAMGMGGGSLPGGRVAGA
jgi:hypothetical protein